MGSTIRIIKADIAIPTYVPNIGMKFNMGIIILINSANGMSTKEKTIKNTTPNIKPSMDCPNINLENLLFVSCKTYIIFSHFSLLNKAYINFLNYKINFSLLSKIYMAITIPKNKFTKKLVIPIVKFNKFEINIFIRF